MPWGLMMKEPLTPPSPRREGLLYPLWRKGKSASSTHLTSLHKRENEKENSDSQAIPKKTETELVRLLCTENKKD